MFPWTDFIIQKLFIWIQKQNNNHIIIGVLKAHLNKMKNIKKAFKRRGTPFTFDCHGLYTLIIKIKEHGHAAAPSFDHKLGDPLFNDIQVKQKYVLLLSVPWFILIHLK